MKITACWIVKNEEENLARSIQSLQSAVDELVVVDTGSTDGTRELAASLGAKVGSFDWIGDFAAARNYAISLAGGDIIIFLDADEWFVPALETRDKEQLIGVFTAEPRLDVLQLNLFNVDIYGVIYSSFLVDRIFRNTHVEYTGAIHERLHHQGGSALRKMVFRERWNLHHSGYQTSLMPQKMRRNIQLLEQSLAGMDPADKGYFMQRTYLMREYKLGGEAENALPHLNYMLRNPGRLKTTCQEYSVNFIDFLYIAMECALTLRDRVSRKEVHRQLVRALENYFPQFAGAATVGLLYETWFDLREDRLLEQLPEALARSERLGSQQAGKARESESILLSYAARALWVRRRKLEAMEMAVKAGRTALGNNPENLQILLSCTRGQPLEDVAALLSSVYDLSHPETLAFLVENTRLEGYRDLHIYFVKKQLDAGAVTKGTFLYLQLLLDKIEPSIPFALELEDDRVVADHLFLCAVCAGEERILREHRERLGPYARVLEAYFAGEPLSALNPDEADILVNMYQPVAFAAGVQTAERLRSVFSVATPLAAYTIFARYCLANEQYDSLLTQDISSLPQDNADIRLPGIRAMLLTGRYRQALEELEAMLRRLGMMDPGLLQLLLVVAECAPPEDGARARALYGEYLPVSEAVIDLQDLVNTGVVFPSYTRKQTAALKILTPAQLQKLLEADAALPAPPVLPPLYAKAAVLYEEQQLPGEAYECYRWLLAHNCEREAAKEGLGRVLLRLGNKTLAAALPAL